MLSKVGRSVPRAEIAGGGLIEGGAAGAGAAGGSVLGGAAGTLALGAAGGLMLFEQIQLSSRLIKSASDVLHGKKPEIGKALWSGEPTGSQGSYGSNLKRLFKGENNESFTHSLWGWWSASSAASKGEETTKRMQEETERKKRRRRSTTSWPCSREPLNVAHVHGSAN